MSDLMVARIAVTLNFSVEWYAPEEGGRHQTYLRDFRMIDACDVVEAFFEDETMPGGTGHLVDAALARGKPVYAWLVGLRGGLTRIGEWEVDEPDRRHIDTHNLF